MNKEKTQYQGWWNGEPCMFTVLNITVGDFSNLEKKFRWYKPFIGQLRQVVEVDYNNRLFYIDNYDGLGLYKVLQGMGGDDFRHREIKPENIICETQRSRWQEYNSVLVTCLDKVICTYFESNGGFTFKQQLRQLEEFKERALF